MILVGKISRSSMMTKQEKHLDNGSCAKFVKGEIKILKEKTKLFGAPMDSPESSQSQD